MDTHTTDMDLLGMAIIIAETETELAELKASRGELERLAYYDELTGLGNRRHLQNTYNDEPLLMMDLNGFKMVNDVYGHAEGDKVLASFAAMLRLLGDAFRLGGDEFVVLTDGWVAPAAEVLRRWVGPYGVTCSVGAGFGSTLSARLATADAAMYNEKRG